MNSLVSFETAKLLKEKGFDGVSLMFYENNGDLLWSDGRKEFEHPWFVKNKSDVDYFIAPTIGEVLMWLYEKRGIWVQSPFSHNDFKPFCWVITTTKRNLSEEEENRNCWLSGIDTEDMDGWDSPTESYEDAILYSLNNLL